MMWIGLCSVHFLHVQKVGPSRIQERGLLFFGWSGLQLVVLSDLCKILFIWAYSTGYLTKNILNRSDYIKFYAVLVSILFAVLHNKLERKVCLTEVYDMF
jgi:hypothetical protein